MSLTTLTYPYYQYNPNGTSRFFGGGRTGRTITFPDAITNVYEIDFSKMSDSSGKIVIMKNPTRNFNGKFLIKIYDQNKRAIYGKEVSVNKKRSVDISKFGVFKFNNITVKYIEFRATTKNANIFYSVDDSSEYKINVKRPVYIIPTAYVSGALLTWKSVLSVGSYRVVRRIDNAYRNIANDSDIYIGGIDSYSSVLVKQLNPGLKYVLVLQKRGSEWYDVAQTSLTTKDLNLRVDDIGSGSIVASWDRDYDGVIYTLNIISPIETTALTTSDLSVVVTNLLANTDYSVEVFVK